MPNLKEKTPARQEARLLREEVEAQPDSWVHSRCCCRDQLACFQQCHGYKSSFQFMKVENFIMHGSLLCRDIIIIFIHLTWKTYLYALNYWLLYYCFSLTYNGVFVTWIKYLHLPGLAFHISSFRWFCLKYLFVFRNSFNILECSKNMFDEWSYVSNSFQFYYRKMLAEFQIGLYIKT